VQSKHFSHKNANPFKESQDKNMAKQNMEKISLCSKVVFDAKQKVNLQWSR
jgi:hypothetical protein